MSARLRGIAKETEQIVAAGGYRAPDGREVSIAAAVDAARAGTRMYGPEPVPVPDAAPVMTFWASPNGAPRTPFVLEPGEGSGVTFVNPDNDYPQRVRYWREGELLRAEISLRDGSNATSWTFRRMGG